MSLQGDLPEGSEFGQWLDHSPLGAAGRSSHRFIPVSLPWVSPATKRREQTAFSKSVLTKDVLEIVK